MKTLECLNQEVQQMLSLQEEEVVDLGLTKVSKAFDKKNQSSNQMNSFIRGYMNIMGPYTQTDESIHLSQELHYFLNQSPEEEMAQAWDEVRLSLLSGYQALVRETRSHVR
jgi:hypothetical protein